VKAASRGYRGKIAIDPCTIQAVADALEAQAEALDGSPVATCALRAAADRLAVAETIDDVLAALEGLAGALARAG